MNTLNYNYRNQLETQGQLLNIDIYHYEKNKDVDILLLKKPSNQKYAIYRCLWDNGARSAQLNEIGCIIMYF